MNESTAQAGLTRTDLSVNLSYESSPPALDNDPNIGDPVNDSGRGPYRGDLQLGKNFICLVRNVLRNGGESFP